MCGGYTGEHDNMKNAVIRAVSRSNKIEGTHSSMYVVDLYKNNVMVGVIELPGKSKYYAEDVVENWQTGILGEDNEHIKKFEESPQGS